MIMENKDYEQAVKMLVEQITDIKDRNSNIKDKSKAIMKLLRKTFIKLENEYLDKFFRKESLNVTIEPYCNQVSIGSEENDIYDSKVKKIFGYSFGPFDPDYYFKPCTLRILWLLKEPLLKDIKQIEGISEGPDQASQYMEMGWNEIKGGEDANKTIYRLIEISKIILEGLGDEMAGVHEAAVMENVMKHICVLEVNHFPGLALNKKRKSDDARIKEWANLNYDLIKLLVDFYSPAGNSTIVIGGYTLGHFFAKTSVDSTYDGKHYFETLKEEISNNGIDILGNTVYEIINTGNYILPTKEGIIYVDACHPSACSYTNTLAEKDAKEIWLIKRFQDLLGNYLAI